MPNKLGFFISLEGIDGAGKSTQAELLASHLSKNGNNVIQTREPGGSKGAEEIRALLVEGEPGRWSPETEILLFTAARRDHLERGINPALVAGKTVITDRFADSTRVYQGAVRADLRDTVDQLHQLMIGRDPDLTLVIDVDPETALSRGLARETKEARFEKFGVDFQRKLRDGFLALVKANPKRCKIVDGNRPAEEIAVDLAALTDKALADHG